MSRLSTDAGLGSEGPIVQLLLLFSWLHLLVAVVSASLLGVVLLSSGRVSIFVLSFILVFGFLAMSVFCLAGRGAYGYSFLEGACLPCTP